MLFLCTFGEVPVAWSRGDDSRCLPDNKSINICLYDCHLVHNSMTFLPHIWFLIGDECPEKRMMTELYIGARNHGAWAAFL